MKPLLFFVDPAWRRKAQHIPLLYPFWGNVVNPVKTPFYHALFERHGFDTRHYGITDDIDRADLVLLPYVHEVVLQRFPELLDECARVAQTAGKKLLVDGTGDIEYKISPEHIVLRYGGYRFDKKKNEIHIPLYAEDLLEVYCGGVLRLRTKGDTPVVGFSGWGELSWRQVARALVREWPDRLRGLFDSRYRARRKGVFFRRQALRTLAQSSLVKTNFLVRSSYSAHRDTAVGDMDVLRREHVETFLQSDYALDVRGDANASIRLFEALSLGRIPVIVDTERNFPFRDKLEYASFALMVDFRDSKRLPEIVAEFHAKLSPERFAQMQQAARNAYVSYFRVDVLTPHLVAEIRAAITKA